MTGPLWAIFWVIIGIGICILERKLFPDKQKSGTDSNKEKNVSPVPRITSEMITYRNSLERLLTDRMDQRAWDILILRRHETLLNKKEVIVQAYEEIIREEFARLEKYKSISI